MGNGAGVSGMTSSLKLCTKLPPLLDNAQKLNLEILCHMKIGSLLKATPTFWGDIHDVISLFQ